MPEHGERAGVGARGATAAQESEREARRRRECQSAGQLVPGDVGLDSQGIQVCKTTDFIHRA